MRKDVIVRIDLYLKGKAKLIGEPKEGYIVIPFENDWKRLES